MDNIKTEKEFRTAAEIYIGSKLNRSGIAVFIYASCKFAIKTVLDEQKGLKEFENVTKWILNFIDGKLIQWIAKAGGWAIHIERPTEAEAEAVAVAEAKAVAEAVALAEAKAVAEAEAVAVAEAEAKATAVAEAVALAEAKAVAEAEAVAVASAEASATAVAEAVAATVKSTHTVSYIVIGIAIGVIVTGAVSLALYRMREQPVEGMIEQPAKDLLVDASVKIKRLF